MSLFHTMRKQKPSGANIFKHLLHLKVYQNCTYIGFIFSFLKENHDSLFQYLSINYHYPTQLFLEEMFMFYTSSFSLPFNPPLIAIYLSSDYSTESVLVGKSYCFLSVKSSNLLMSSSFLIPQSDFSEIDILWCWRRLLRVPWTARRSNPSILKEISPECSLEGRMLKLKLHQFGHMMQRTASFEKILMLEKIEGRRRG